MKKINLQGYAEDENDYNLIFQTYDRELNNEKIYRTILKKGKFFFLILNKYSKGWNYAEEKYGDVRIHFTEKPSFFIYFYNKLSDLHWDFHKFMKNYTYYINSKPHFSSLRVFEIKHKNKFHYLPTIQISESELSNIPELYSKYKINNRIVKPDFEIKDITNFYKDNYFKEFREQNEKHAKINKYQYGKFSVSNFFYVSKRIKPTEKSKYSEFGFYKNKYDKWIYAGNNLKDYSKHWSKRDLIVVHIRDNKPQIKDVIYKFKGYPFNKSIKSIEEFEERKYNRWSSDLYNDKVKVYHYDGYNKPKEIISSMEFCLQKATTMFYMKNLKLMTKELKSLKIK